MDKEQAKRITMERMGWDEAEFAERQEWVEENCICTDCPTYVDEETKTGFCWATNGISRVIAEENECICGQCPVFNQAQMRTAYYCTRDSELAQLWELSEGLEHEEVA